MNKGYIIVQLSTANSALPVEYAKVIITRNENDSIVFKKEVDVSTNGKTNKIEVSTPPIEFSFDPKGRIIPYTCYDVKIYSNDFICEEIHGIQVFSGITTLQNVNMIPKNSSELIVNNTVIEPHVLLLEDNSSNQVGPKLGAPSSYINKKPYIPEFIVVHLGLADDKCENLTMPFIDYIKNVSSCEIYPTWPDDAIKANVYAQISFALNRIYSNWYMSKGYDFHITNNKELDQTFIKGRNIYTNINKIVDSIFNKYISVIGFDEPLFSKYCDNCAENSGLLSKWGSLDLAKQYYSTLAILQYYYGYNIELSKISNIDGICENFSGSTLKAGMQGSNIRLIQKQLNRIANNYPYIPKINPVDGVFSKSTETSVTKFQDLFNLAPDGNVNKSTWYRISYLYVAVKNLSDLNFTLKLPNLCLTNDEERQYPGFVLRDGSSGKYVHVLQFYLNCISEFYKSIPSLSVDSIFGNETKNCVLGFQKKFNLNIDGIVGQETWNEISKVFSSIKNEINKTNDNILSSYPGYILKDGSVGLEVEKIQTYLKSISKYYKVIQNVPTDAIFDRNTKKAVISFQKLFSLYADGIVGFDTWTKIYDLYNNLDSSKNSLEPKNTYPFPKCKIQFGDHTPFVRILQLYLNIISCNIPDIKQVNIDGYYGDRTFLAIYDFQKLFNLRTSGIIDEPTWNKILDIYSALWFGDKVDTKTKSHRLK